MSVRAFGAGFALGILASAGFMWQRDQASAAELQAARTATAAALAVRAARIDTVIKYVPVVEQAKEASRAAGELVTIVNATTLSVKTTPSAQPQLVGVPAAVIAKMRTDSIYIAELEAQNLRMSLVIASDSSAVGSLQTQVRVLEEQLHPRCGRRCGIVIGVTATVAAVLVVDRVRAVVQNSSYEVASHRSGGLRISLR